MGSFKEYIEQRLFNEMGYMILQQPTSMPIGLNDEPISIRMFDMRYEDYPVDYGFRNRLGQWTPVVGKIPGTARSYLVYDGDKAVIAKLMPNELKDLLAKDAKMGSKTVKYTMLPDNWYQFATPVQD